MTCQEFPLLYSAQIDGHADEHEQLALQKHLRECAYCRRRAAEMRCLRSELRAMESPQPGIELASRIQAALRREERTKVSSARRRADWLDLWRTRLFSQSIGAVTSMVMFLVVVAGIFGPASRTLNLARVATQVILRDSTPEEIRLKVLLLQPPPPPVFNPSGELLGIGASLSEDDEMIATVKVHKDGRASINQIVVPPRDPSVMTKFSSVIMQQASFQPARRDKNTSAEAVVIFSKVNISG